MRDLENSVINGRAPAANPQGSSTVRRTMRGILGSITSNRFKPGTDGFPAGSTLIEVQLNEALRRIWNASSGRSTSSSPARAGSPVRATAIATW
jgi:hypothetical protein